MQRKCSGKRCPIQSGKIDVHKCDCEATCPCFTPEKGPTNGELLRSLEYIDKFVGNIRGGDSFWIDPDGGKHFTDVCYGIEFWDQVSEYLKSKIK